MDIATKYNEHADAWAKRLAEGNNPAHRWLEKPALAANLPSLANAKVLALGCGSGEECALYHAAGAEAVVGIDVSDALIAKAKVAWPTDEFLVGSMEDLSMLADESFDCVVSSLAFHYLASWTKLLAEIHRVLKPGGVLLFSTHHPAKWGGEVHRGSVQDSIGLSYVKFKDGSPPEVHGDYLGTRSIQDTWFGSMSVEYIHRSLESVMADLLSSPLVLERFLEPKPIPECEQGDPNFWAIHSRIPLFLVVRMKKPA